MAKLRGEASDSEQKQYQTEIFETWDFSLVQNLGSAVDFVANASRLLNLPEKEDGVRFGPLNDHHRITVTYLLLIAEYIIFSLVQA